jgi:hypothetical protein
MPGGGGFSVPISRKNIFRRYSGLFADCSKDIFHIKKTKALNPPFGRNFWLKAQCRIF